MVSTVDLWAHANPYSTAKSSLTNCTILISNPHKSPNLLLYQILISFLRLHTLGLVPTSHHAQGNTLTIHLTP